MRNHTGMGDMNISGDRGIRIVRADGVGEI